MFGLSWAQLKLIGLLVGFGLSFAAGGAVMHRLDEGRYQKLVADQAKAETAAQVQARKGEQRQAAVVTHAAGTAARAQERILTHTITLTQEIHDHVPPVVDHQPCVPYGFVRLHDAAAYGVGIADTGVPAGQPDDACAPFAWADIAAVVVQNYGAARQNAQQLGDLQQFERDRAAAYSGSVLLQPEAPAADAVPGGASLPNVNPAPLVGVSAQEYNSAMPFGIHLHVHHHFGDPLTMSFKDQVDRAIAAITKAQTERDAAYTDRDAQKTRADKAEAALAAASQTDSAADEATLSGALDAAGVDPVAPAEPPAA